MDMDNQWGKEFAGRVYGKRIASAMVNLSDSDVQDELNEILNIRPDPIDQRDYLYRSSLVELPSAFLNKHCISNKIKIRSQGSEGSCVGQAIASVIDLQDLSRNPDKDGENFASARFLYENAKLYDHHPEDSLPGSSLRGAIKGFFHNGACSNEKSPYRPLPAKNNFRIENEMREEAKAVSLGTYHRLQHVLNDYHCALIEAGSILCSAIIHDGWAVERVRGGSKLEHHQSDGEIKYPFYLQSGARKPCNLRGGHAFVIIGYDRTGFLVLNSWSENWGHYPTSRLSKYIKTDLGRCKLPGIAHWRYEDWADNVLDAWILRLAAPTGKGTGYLGGRSQKVSEEKKSSSTARKRDVQGYYLHVSDGCLVDEPPYENDLEYFDEIAKEIQRDASIHSLVFFAHGGLSTLNAASSRAAAMIPTFRKNGIYPVFFFWRTGFGEMLGSVIDGITPGVLKRTQDFVEMRDASIERLAKPIGRAIWNDVRRNADACFNKNYKDFEDSGKKPSGTAWQATKKLLDVCKDTDRRYPIKIHFIAHSAGVFMLGALFNRIYRQEKTMKGTNIGTVSLFAPCCRTSYFKANIVEPLQGKLDSDELTVFNLDSASEQSMDPAMAPYSKSLASLVSNSFYDERPAHIVALDEYWQEDIVSFMDNAKNRKLKRLVDYVLSGHKSEDGIVRSNASYHGDFDNDEDTMNTVLKKILGKNRSRKFNVDLSGFNSEQLNRGDF